MAKKNKQDVAPVEVKEAAPQPKIARPGYEAVSVALPLTVRAATYNSTGSAFVDPIFNHDTKFTNDESVSEKVTRIKGRLF